MPIEPEYHPIFRVCLRSAIAGGNFTNNRLRSVPEVIDLFTSYKFDDGNKRSYFKYTQFIANDGHHPTVLGILLR